MSEYEIYRGAFAFLSGYFLCLSGSLTQLTVNNNLASPSTLGFDGLGAICVIASQALLAILGINLSLETFSFILFLSVFAALFLPEKLFKQGASKALSLDIKFLILIGLSFNLFVGAVFSVIQFMFIALGYEFPSGLWFGSFGYFKQWWLWIFFFFFVLSATVTWRNAKGLRLMSLGKDFARGKGVDIVRTQKRALLLSLVLTGLVISFFGVFSFLSLILPHLLRGFGYFRKNMRRELQQGPLLAGFALFGLDSLCFNFPYMGAEFPAGMVSSVAGAFLLIFLLLKSKAKFFAKD